MAKELESTCYNSKLNIRVTYVENNCCSVERLAYLATSSHPPQPAYPTTVAANALDRKAGGVHLNIRGADTEESQATRKMAQSGLGSGEAAAAGAGTAADAQNAAAGSADDKASTGGSLGRSETTGASQSGDPQQYRSGVGGTAARSADPAPAWAPGGPDNTTVVAYLNCGCVCHFYRRVLRLSMLRWEGGGPFCRGPCTYPCTVDRRALSSVVYLRPCSPCQPIGPLNVHPLPCYTILCTLTPVTAW